MASIRFVPQTGMKDHDQGVRKAIRRHVMLGKNKGRVNEPKQPKLRGCAVYRKEDWEQASRSAQPITLRNVGSHLSFLEFADAVDPPLMHDTLEFCSTTDKNLYMLEPCIAFDSVESSVACVQALTSDALHLHIMVFSAQAYMNQIFWQTTGSSRRSPREAVFRHYGKALYVLRQRLAETQQRQPGIFGIVVMSIIALAMQALFTGDVLAARNHIDGLRHIVSTMQHGTNSFNGTIKQMLELLRCDVSISLATGRVPLFAADFSFGPVFPLPELLAIGEKLESCPVPSNDELVKVWDILVKFCAVFNSASASQRKVPDQTLLWTMAWVIYQLLYLDTPYNSADEAIRLAMICFCASALLRWRRLRLPLDWLRLECTRSFKNLMQPHSTLLNSEVTLWYLVTYTVTFSPFFAGERAEAQVWLADAMASCGVTSWTSARKVVANFLWIDIVCETPALAVIDEILAAGITSSD